MGEPRATSGVERVADEQSITALSGEVRPGEPDDEPSGVVAGVPLDDGRVPGDVRDVHQAASRVGRRGRSSLERPDRDAGTAFLELPRERSERRGVVPAVEGELGHDLEPRVAAGIGIDSDRGSGLAAVRRRLARVRPGLAERDRRSDGGDGDDEERAQHRPKAHTRLSSGRHENPFHHPNDPTRRARRGRQAGF